MGSSDRLKIRTAMAAIRNCADRMEEHAASLLQLLPTVPMDSAVRATALDLCKGLQVTAGRVAFELALLQTELDERKADTTAATHRLVSLDATMMDALAPVAELADQLESAAERDEQFERAFVLVIEAAGVMMQALEKARAATAGVADPSARP
jgi:hypothetical protein